MNIIQYCPDYDINKARYIILTVHFQLNFHIGMEISFPQINIDHQTINKKGNTNDL